uniref:Peptidase S1 domain-containing protein n=1 Tax=Apteryx owenii TaxID=8824 RepID=A0A8B9S3E0_APTOW
CWFLVPKLSLSPAGKKSRGTPIDESRIIGGRPCSINQRPFQVALTKRGQILCGGSLIASQWVLTAAHSKLPKNLQCAGIMAFGRQKCTRAYGSSTITPNMFCAGVPQGGVDSCQVRRAEVPSATSQAAPGGRRVLAWL